MYATTGGTRNNDHDLIGSGFDLSAIPDGSTINSVALEVEYKLSATTSRWTGTLLAVKNGSQDNGTAITTTTEPTVDTVWRNTGTGSYTKETLAQLGVLFRVRRSSIFSCTYSVDYLAIEVDYTAPETAPETVNINVPVSTGSVVAFAPTVSTQKSILIDSVVSDISVSANPPELRTDNVLLIPMSSILSQAKAPEISIDYPVLIQPPVSNATATMLTPLRESTSKLMTIDSLLNLAVLGEIVEGSVVNLDKYGVLTIVEIIEGSTFNLSSTGVLTINTVTEGGV